MTEQVSRSATAGVENVEEFVLSMIKELNTRLTRHGVEPGLRAEVVSLAMLRLAARLDETTKKYSSGTVYARAIWRTVLVDSLRTDGAQKGTGFNRSRQAIALTQFTESWVAPDLVELVDDRLMLQSALPRLTFEERRDLKRVVIDGYNLVEVGHMNGESHTTISRRVRSAARRLRESLQP
jgi:RNA polymerase sigma factor (sigma-70 family)